MKNLSQSSWNKIWAGALAGVFSFFGFLPQSTAEDADYGGNVFGGSAYVQAGPGPAYEGAYARYGRNARGIEGRFSSAYSEYHSAVGYGRFGSGSTSGTGPLKAAGTGRGSAARRQERRGQTAPKKSSRSDKKKVPQLPF